MPTAKEKAYASGATFRVTGDPLNLRSSAADKGPANLIEPMPWGTVVSATGKTPSGNWVQVTASLAGGAATGWCHLSYLEPFVAVARASTRGAAKAAAGAAPGGIFRVANTDSLNLRSKPAVLTPATLIAAMPRGHAVTRVADSKTAGWMEVDTIINGTTLRGFCHSAFLAAAEHVPADSFTEVQIPEKAMQLILDFEGMDQPAKWPGSSSGISLGHGYDLGYYSRDEFETDWGPHLTASQITRLARAIGKRGTAARDIASNYDDIKITVPMADEVFRRSTIKKIKAMTSAAFPGVLRLPPLAQGGLASLVYNRGGSMQGDRRREMRDIRDTVASTSLSNTVKVARISDSILEMKRLWLDVPGLRRRRDAEAKLIRESV